MRGLCYFLVDVVKGWIERMKVLSDMLFPVGFEVEMRFGRRRTSCLVHLVPLEYWLVDELFSTGRGPKG